MTPVGQLKQSGSVIDAVAAVEIAADITLSGEQTIDGIALIAGDRVLLTQQSDETANGVWVVAADAWTRPADFATGATLQSGSPIFVAGGNRQLVLVVVALGPPILRDTGFFYGPFVVDTDHVTFDVVADATMLTWRGENVLPQINAPLEFDGVAIIAPFILTTDPHIAGALWNDAGTPAISLG